MLNNSKIDGFALGLADSLIECAKKIKENDAYNPSGSGPAREPSEPSASGQKMNISDEKKKTKKACECDECAMDNMKPGYNKTDRGYA